MDHGFEVFLPLVQTKRASQPLFSSYFFCRIVDRWRAINSTFGVLCLVRVGDCPARCPDHEVDSLKAMMDARGYVRLPGAPAAPAGRKIAIGAKVRITAGPFGGMSGLYAGQSTRERELILLNLLAGNVRCRSPPAWSLRCNEAFLTADRRVGDGLALEHLVTLGRQPCGAARFQRRSTRLQSPCQQGTAVEQHSVLDARVGDDERNP